jgi:hypothetical protein
VLVADVTLLVTDMRDLDLVGAMVLGPPHAVRGQREVGIVQAEDLLVGAYGDVALEALDLVGEALLERRSRTLRAVAGPESVCVDGNMARPHRFPLGDS